MQLDVSFRAKVIEFDKNGYSNLASHEKKVCTARRKDKTLQPTIDE